MAKVVGFAGSVTIGVIVHLNVTEWSGTVTEEPVESTGMDDAGWRTHEPGLRGGTFSFTANVDQAAGAASVPPAQGAKAAFSFDTDAAPKVNYAGTAVVNSVAPAVAVDGLVTYTCEITADGAIVIT